MKIDNAYRVYRLLAAGLMTLIFWLSSQPHLPVPINFPLQDKVAHLMVYGLLGVFFARSFKPRNDVNALKRIFWITGLVTLYGISDEFHQFFVPGREFALDDMAANALGGFIAAVFFGKQ